ncbi:hypothetical protein TNCV_1257121 [Trichonephila clavipes]|nr:hypothetical protein TNCV_1257121 [Trichonephila clavipes]
MSDISDFMDFSPTRQSKVAACEKLRDTVHSISAMHSSISEGARTPTKKNSFLELYQMTSFDLAKKKDRCQDSNNTSDLTQVLELFQIISNLVKKNPKILDLLTKFKKLTQMKKNLPSRRSNYG